MLQGYSAEELARPAKDCLSARDEPGTAWPTFHGDDGRTGNHSGSGPESNRVLWSNNTGGNEYSSPVVAGGRVFIGSIDRNLYCFNATTGERLWRFNAGNSLQASPAVTPDGGRVIIGNVNRNVYCVNVNDGSSAWSATVDGGMDGSPLVHGGKAYISTLAGSLYCLDVATGAQDWRVADAGGEASPATEDGRLFSVGDSRLWCLDLATGAHFWNVTVSEFYSSPTASGGYVYLPGGDGSVSCFNASTGSRSWRTATGWAESTSTAAISNGSVYVCVDSQAQNRGALVKLDASDGRIVWTYQVAGDPYNAPAVAGDRVYFSYARTVACVNASDRSVIWTYQAASADQYGVCSSPALAFGNLYIGGVESKLFCFGQGAPNRPPAALKLEPPTEIRETSMVLKWNRSTEADFARYELHRSLLPGFVPSQLTLLPNGNITSVDTLMVNASGLNYSTIYYFKLRVWDNGFPPMYNDSAEVEGTTLTPNGAPTPVRLFPAEDVTPFSVRLAWSVNGDSDFDRYEVHRGTSKAFLPVPSTLVTTIVDASDNTTVTSGLRPWTTYFFKLRVYDNGTPILRSDSNEIEILTGNTPPVAVTLNQPQMGSTSADLSWSESADDDFARYEVHYSLEAGFSPGNGTRATSISNRLSTDHSITGLQLARTYHFLVRVVDQGGLSNDSNEAPGLTANTVPKPVISSPGDGDLFDTRTPVDFDGSASSDQDLDPLSFHWLSSVDGYLSSNATFTRYLSEGSHRISLFVNDGHGHNVSARVALTVNKAPNRRPAVTVLSPSDNARVSGVVTFRGTALDVDGNDTLRSVESKIAKGDWEEVDGVQEWTYSWNTTKTQNGRVKVAFRAFDGTDYSPEVAVSVVVENVFINIRPTVKITSPAGGGALSRTQIIAGTASDSDGRVTRVELSLNGGGWQPALGTDIWTFSLDTAGLRNGRHYLQVRAYDGTDYSDSEQLNFTVSNAAASTPNGPSLLLLGGMAAVILIAVIAAVMLMRRKKGPGQATGAAQPVSGQEAAAQRGLVPADGEMMTLPAPPAYSAFYQQGASDGAHAQQPAAGDGTSAPQEAAPVQTEEPTNPQGTAQDSAPETPRQMPNTDKRT